MLVKLMGSLESFVFPDWWLISEHEIMSYRTQNKAIVPEQNLKEGTGAIAVRNVHAN
jgi:hypothetical protein